ncbi:MAG TPA: SirB2 family protein [Cytophagaceae bacterium]|jgi:mono/diheme cytochrome c family protein|nr:SirB2 family protein [Cytophagaceae bacterium]
MAKGFLHLHITVVVLFMIFFGYKLILLLTNKKEKLAAFRQKTKIVDMILGSLILITGGYLLYALHTVAPYLIGKLILTLVAIPLGIISMKKENKLLGVLTMVIFVYNFGVAETNSLTLQKEKIVIQPTVTMDTAASTATPDNTILEQNNEVALQNGKAIYVQVCSACHGQDGKLGVSGAKDLSQSKLTHTETVLMIAKGKGLMQSYEGMLSEQEIEAVATYIEGLRTK